MNIHLLYNMNLFIYYIIIIMIVIIIKFHLPFTRYIYTLLKTTNS